ncbi:12721_t:CDS:2 [Ambispora gerdemannii]|uniref:12721_t:CDS:1 n=1 Tax=Ambispora gerdemannii TaxID=144530 RepID=A0A9N9CS90_9GLOM|nr:12721_t:CDS:2 [Ambispora gerdemannii]
MAAITYSPTRPVAFTHTLNELAGNVKRVEVEGLDNLIVNRVLLRDLANRVERYTSINKKTSQKISVSLRSLGDLSFDIALDLDEMVNKGDNFLSHFQRDVRAIHAEIVSNGRKVRVSIVAGHLEKILRLVHNLELHVRKVKSNVHHGMNIRDKVDQLLLDGKYESQKFHEKRKQRPLAKFIFGESNAALQAEQEVHSLDVTTNLLKMLGDQLNVLDSNLLRFQRRLSDLVTELKNADGSLEFTSDDSKLLEDAVEKARIGSKVFIKMDKDLISANKPN